MILYNVSVNMRDDMYQNHPDAFDAMAEAMLSGLSQERMTELNALVSAEGEAPDADLRSTPHLFVGDDQLTIRDPASS